MLNVCVNLCVCESLCVCVCPCPVIYTSIFSKRLDSFNSSFTHREKKDGERTEEGELVGKGECEYKGE